MRHHFLILLIVIAAVCCLSLPAWADEVSGAAEPAVAPLEGPDQDDPQQGGTSVSSDYYSYSGTWINTLIHEVVITNNSRSMAFNITVDIPLMDEATPLYSIMNNEVLSPQPDQITTDENGDRTAHHTSPCLYGNESVTI